MSKKISLMRKYYKLYGKMWPENYVNGSENNQFPKSQVLKNYFKILSSGCNENKIHKYIKENPIILSCFIYGGQGNWVFSKPKFGSEYTPDFLICTLDSGGFHWALIELESPNKKPLRKDGQQTAYLSNSIRQINEWRIWLRKNIKYAQDELGLIDINAECIAMIVIGRRKNILPELRDYYNELSNDKLKVLSYDRLGWRL